MVSYASKRERSTVLYGDSGVQEQWPELFEDSQLVEVVDVLWLGGKIGQLLGELYLGFLKLFKGQLQRLH